MPKGINRAQTKLTHTREMAHTAAVAAGEIVVVNGAVAMAMTGADANVATMYIVESPDVEMPKKASLAVLAGDKVYWDTTPGEITKTSADGVLCGICRRDAAANDTVVAVELMRAAAL